MELVFKSYIDQTLYGRNVLFSEKYSRTKQLPQALDYTNQSLLNRRYKV
jgi:hypothetical protein